MPSRLRTALSLRIAAMRWLFLLVGIFALGASASACGPSDPCRVASGYYLVHAPLHWDGKSPLPAVMLFHGYRETAETTMANEDLVKRMERRGVLLIVPNGEGQTWSYTGSPQHLRDDYVFVEQILADVGKRYPIDAKRLIASGFSQGGSMVWNLACEMGERFAGFAPISGAFWKPLPSACLSGPLNVLHVHGTADRTVPLEGRALRGGAFTQGDVRLGWRSFLASNRCPSEPTSVSMGGGLSCEVWRGCGAAGRELQLCLHPGGHDFDPRFVEDAVVWIDGLASQSQ